jgi:hypothetical protein
MQTFGYQGFDSGTYVNVAPAGGLANGAFEANIQSFICRKSGYGCAGMDKISIANRIHVGPHKVGNGYIFRTCGHAGAAVLAEQSAS